jgi:alkanesulfonate monooxygenase SsuD/methylene tetrahydromethanopterin reductase-like flavin-dependent oxidoreductase (luciferase family)
MDLAVWDPFSGGDFHATGDPSAVYDWHISQVREAEELGYDQYYLIEHQNNRSLRLTSAAVMLAAMARETSVIRIGTMIWPLPFHNPMRLAQDVATLDHLSHGRIEFGTGIGTQEVESVRFGLDYAERQAMGEEALEIIRLAWSEDEVTYDGKFWHYLEHIPFPLPYQQPHPPIWAGCHSYRAHEFAARNGFGCAQNIETTEDLAERLAFYRKVWADTQPEGTRPRAFLMRQVYVDETNEKAHAVARARFGNTWGMENRALAHQRYGLDPSGYGREAELPENIARNRLREMLAGPSGYEWGLEQGIFIVGSPEAVVEQITRTSEKMGGLDVFCANFEFGRMPVEQARKALRLFGKEVLPEVSSL